MENKGLTLRERVERIIYKPLNPESYNGVQVFIGGGFSVVMATLEDYKRHSLLRELDRVIRNAIEIFYWGYIREKGKWEIERHLTGGSLMGEMVYHNDDLWATFYVPQFGKWRGEFSEREGRGEILIYAPWEENELRGVNLKIII